MKRPCVWLAAALLPALWPLAAAAQTSAAPPAGVASAAPAAKPPAKPAPKLMTPAEVRDSAPAPGAVRPEHAVTPQISVPLGKTPPSPGKAPAGTGQAAPAGGIQDSVARCQAMESEQARANCRDRLKGKSTTPKPG